MKQYDIFISYSRKDLNFAEEMCAILDEYKKHYKFEYFFDREDIKSKHDYLVRIADAISESKTVLFLASKYSLSSEFCLKELLFADKEHVRIHQYRIDNNPYPKPILLLLGNHHYREASSYSKNEMVREVLSETLGQEINDLYNRDQSISMNHNKYKKLKLAGVCILIITFLAVGISMINSLMNKGNIDVNIDIINTDSVPIRKVNTDSIFINNENTDTILNKDRTNKNVDNLDSIEPIESPYMILQGHTDEINSICYSANGDRIISGSNDKTIKIWDTSSGLCLNTLKGHASSVKSVCYSHGEKKIISGAYDKTVRVWDAITGDCLHIIETELYTINCIKLNPLNDQVLVTSGTYHNKLFYLIDVNTGKKILTFEGHDAGINDVCFSKDGSLIFSASKDNSVCIWDANTGKCIKKLVAHQYGVDAIEISPNGNIIISESFDGVMCVWNAKTGNLLKKYERNNCAYDLSFSTDGKYILRSVAHGTQIIDIANGDIIKIFKDNHVITSSMYSPNGKMVAAAQGFSYGRNILIWSLPESLYIL